MNGSSRHHLAVLLSISLCGCAATGPQRIGTDAQPQFTATQVIAHVPQTGLAANSAITSINTLQTLIGAAFDTDRTMSKDASQATASLRASLANFNFDEQWLGALESSLREASWLNAQAPALAKDESFAEALKRRNLKSPATLISTSRYALSSDLSTLRIATHVCVFLNSKKQQAHAYECGGAVYRNTLSYSVKRARLKGQTENLAAWLSEDSLRNALQTGTKVLASMVASDISDPEPAPQGAVQTFMVHGQAIQALGVKESADGVMARYANGSIGYFAVPLKP